MTTMHFISIKELGDAAEARGFKVRRYSHGANLDGKTLEIWAADHKGPEAIWNFDSQYSTAQIVIDDSCDLGYGYNPFFYGPFHPGLCRSTCHGLKQLLAHPAMHGFSPSRA